MGRKVERKQRTARFWVTKLRIKLFSCSQKWREANKTFHLVIFAGAANENSLSGDRMLFTSTTKKCINLRGTN